MSEKKPARWGSGPWAKLTREQRERSWARSRGAGGRFVGERAKSSGDILAASVERDRRRQAEAAAERAAAGLPSEEERERRRRESDAMLAEADRQWSLQRLRRSKRTRAY